MLSLLVVVGLSYGVAAAGDISGNANSGVARSAQAVDVTGFKSPATLDQSSKQFKSPPNPHPNLKPQLGGIIYDGVTKYGAQLVNPAAPDSYGYGEKYLTAPDPRYDLAHESGPAAHRDAGGFKIFSLEF